MSAPRVRWVAVVSRTAAALRVAWEHDPLVRRQLHSVVADRACPAEAWARAQGLATARIEEPDNGRFSDALLAHLRGAGATHAVLFFTRLLRGPLLEAYGDRIVNLHPSLLPAFPGLHGYRDARAAGVRFVGTTLHLVDEHVDAGRTILQSVAPLDWEADEAAGRHRQFEQLCRGLVQVCHWLEEDRVVAAGPGTRVRGARFDDVEFAPALDAPAALSLRVPRPAQDDAAPTAATGSA